MSEPVLSLQGIARTYRQGATRLRVLDGVSLDVQPGQLVALVGPSGSGKSTLLHIAGLLEAPDAGEVAIAGQPCVGLNDAERTRLRRLEIGFVYQFHNLLPEFSALENVALPQLMTGTGPRAAREEGARLLDRLGLGERMLHRPAELSGGEQQRVAIARALANRPGLLLADEPTGNLDPKTARHVFSELLSLARNEGVAGLVATHNLDLASHMDRIVLLRDGGLVEGSDAAEQYRSL